MRVSSRNMQTKRNAKRKEEQGEKSTVTVWGWFNLAKKLESQQVICRKGRS